MRRLVVALVLAALWLGSAAPVAAQWSWAGDPTTNPWAGGCSGVQPLRHLDDEPLRDRLEL